MKKNIRRVSPRKYGDKDLGLDLEAIKQMIVEYRYSRVETENLMNNIEILYMRVLAHLEQKNKDTAEDPTAQANVSENPA